MRWQELTEGLIKVPEDSVNRAYAFFVNAVLAGAISQKLDDATDREMVKSVVSRLRSKTEQDVLVKGRSVSKQQELTVPERYAEKLRAKGIKKISTRYKQTIVFKGSHPYLDGDESGLFNSEPPTMVLNASKLGLSPDKVVDLILSGQLKELKSRLEHAKSVIEHELAHGVQFLVLQKLHPEQARSGESNDTQTPEYHAADIEFDPILRSTVREFKRAYKRPTHAEIKKFVWGDKVPDKLDLVGEIESGRNKYFGSLRLLKPSKWKRAVKLFTTEVTSGPT